MDQITVSNDEGTKSLLGIKLREFKKPVVYLGMQNRGGRASHSITLTPRAAAELADWILEPISDGWGTEPVLMASARAPEDVLTVPVPAPAPDMRGEKAAALCFALNVLAWKLPAEYGPAWIAGELAAAGLPIEWDSQAERFIAKPLIGASR